MIENLNAVLLRCIINCEEKRAVKTNREEKVWLLASRVKVQLWVG